VPFPLGREAFDQQNTEINPASLRLFLFCFVFLGCYAQESTTPHIHPDTC